ncbi:hypothetical protein [Alicyclobacillus sp. SO9]|uniref:hypothetical protein n=1 Tax=Alicyclobacillus sp. SO9 TaxID=2665646 RepID=UPI0018E704A2|nr:hypothetical protein [Alicyclobacillus sp. SO9]QQE79364.1 hypothetical protein GI364_02325 [Alicyclobacillus sp. SO9]
MSTSAGKPNRAPVLSGIYQGIDYATAILLLTGQITTTGVFAFASGLSLSLSGPILGGIRLSGTSKTANAIIDGMDILVALLLIIGELRVIGPFVGPRSLYIVVTGAPLGDGVPIPSHSETQEHARAAEGRKDFYRALRQTVVDDFVLKPLSQFTAKENGLEP